MTVTVKPNFGKTTFLYEALKRGYRYLSRVYRCGDRKSPSSQHHKSVMIQKQSTKLLEMGSSDKTTWLLLKPMAYQNTYAVAVPKKIAQEYGLQDYFRFEKVEGQPGRLYLGFTDREDGNKGLCRRSMVSTYKCPPWSQPFATRRSSLGISR